MKNLNAVSSLAKELENLAVELQNIANKYSEAQDILAVNDTKKTKENISKLEESVTTLKKCQTNLTNVASLMLLLEAEIRRQEAEKLNN